MALVPRRYPIRRFACNADRVRVKPTFIPGAAPALKSWKKNAGGLSILALPGDQSIDTKKMGQRVEDK